MSFTSSGDFLPAVITHRRESLKKIECRSKVHEAHNGGLQGAPTMLKCAAQLVHLVGASSSRPLATLVRVGLPLTGIFRRGWHQKLSHRRVLAYVSTLKANKEHHHSSYLWQQLSPGRKQCNRQGKHSTGSVPLTGQGIELSLFLLTGGSSLAAASPLLLRARDTEGNPGPYCYICGPWSATAPHHYASLVLTAPQCSTSKIRQADPMCPLCMEEPQTVGHWLQRCPNLDVLPLR